jgi:hypothetical protein
MDKIISLFDFPKQTYMNKRIPIKAIIEAYTLLKADESLLRSHIESLELVSALNTTTTLLKSFEDEEMNFTEIHVFYCKLKKSNESIKLDQRLHFFFQNPTIFIYEFKNKYRITISKKRKNKLIDHESVVEKTYYTNLLDLEDFKYSLFFNQLSYTEKKFINLKDLFFHYYELIVHASLVKYLNTYPKHLFNVELVQHSIDQVESIGIEINKYKEILKSAFSMSERIEINEKIIKCELEIKSILNHFNGVDNDE